MRNLKNFNHWIAELRDLAIKLPVQNIDENTKEVSNIPLNGIKLLFNKDAYADEFKKGLTPSEALDNTMDAWYE